MDSLIRDPRTIFRESYDGPRFPTPRTDDPIAAFRETYNAGRRPSAFDLGMRDANDVDNDDIQALNDTNDRSNDVDDADHAKDAGGGMMHHACSSCGHGNTVAPPVGYRLKRKSDAVDESEPARVFSEAYWRAVR